MSKHTPGPWKISMAAPYHHYQVSSVSGERVCGTFDALDSDAPPDRRRENAKLIAAAPTMLASLYELAEYLAEREDVVDGDYGQPKPNREMTLLREVRDAIEKATGESA